MTLEKSLRYVCLAGIFLIPFIVLYVSKSLFFPFITGKNFAFRIIVEIITGGWLALALVHPAYRPKRTWLLWGFSAFLILIAISDLFGVYPHKSFWSNYERMEGWITLAHLFLFFLVAQSILTTERLWKQWWHTSLFVSGLVGLYALLQLVGFITINQGGIRLDATFGNSTYLGVYMLFHIFIAALYFARAWIEQSQGNRPVKGGKERKEVGSHTRWALVLGYSSLIALNTFILFFTSTRGAILGLIGGAALACIILIVLSPRSRVAWRAGAAVFGLIVLGATFWLVSDKAWVHKIEPLHRLATIVDEGVPVARRMNVNMAIEGFKERPILGWGQENYSAVFDKNYNPKMYGQEPWFDRVHNIIFDWLIAGGILGLVAYLSLYLFTLIMIWKSRAFEAYERAILTGLIAGYFFYLIFTFDNITSYIFFIALLSYIVTRWNEDAPKPSAPVLPLSLFPFVALGAIILTCGTTWLVNASAIAQNRAIIKGISPQQEGVVKNLEYLKSAVSYSSVGDQEAREQFSQAAISIIGTEGIPSEFKQQFVTDAQKAMAQIMEVAPQNARFPFFIGILLDQAGAYAEAEKALKRAHELSPGKQAILFELGLNSFARNAVEEAISYFKMAYESAPEFTDAHVYYIAALIRGGKDAEADTLLQPLIASDTATDRRIASAYVARNRFDKVVAIWTAHTMRVPTDFEARFVLAGAYYAAGNPDAALKELEALKRDNPTVAAQADTLIQQLKSGGKIE